MPPTWTPDPARVSGSRMTAFTREAERRAGRTFASYADLHRWSIASSEAFWPLVWEFCGVIGDRGTHVAADIDRMPGARFFPDARLNFAENLLRREDDGPAMIATTETGADRMISWAALSRDVRRAAEALRRAGVGHGDRVCGVMANVPEAIVAALAASAIGAVWSSCSPDFGVQGIVDRFGQIEPVALLTVCLLYTSPSPRDS